LAPGDCRVQPRFETIFTKARATGLGAGSHAWFNLDSQVRLVNMGPNMLIHKADIIFAIDGLKSELGEIRSRLGLHSEPRSTSRVNI
jgi:hypothetical protein